MAELTDKDFRSLSAYLSTRAKAHVVFKQDAIEMKMMASVIDDVRGILGSSVISMTGKDWMERYATTIGPLVYIPENWSPLAKVCGLVHEIQHVHQWNKRQPQSDLPSDLGFAWLYLTSGEARVRFEVEGYRAGQLEAYRLLTGTIPDLGPLAAPLEGPTYILSDEDKKLAHVLLGVAGTTVESGVFPSTEAGRDFHRWFRYVRETA